MRVAVVVGVSVGSGVDVLVGVGVSVEVDGGMVTVGLTVAGTGVARVAQAVAKKQIKKMGLVRIPRLYLYPNVLSNRDNRYVFRLDTERMFVYIYSTNERIMLNMPELAGGTYDDGSKKQRAQ